MARPKRTPWALNISYTRYDENGRVIPEEDKVTPAKTWRARSTYNDALLRRHDVTAQGTSKGKAKTALESKVAAAREAYKGGDSALGTDTPLVRAARTWLDWKQREGLRQATVDEYAGYIARTLETGSLSTLTVGQANDVGRIEAWLAETADQRGHSAAKQARKVLSGVLKLAERRGAVPASVMSRVETPKPRAGSTGDRRCRDADCDYTCDKRHLDTNRAFTKQEARSVIRACKASRADIGDLAAFLFGTGARISEALHCTAWDDVDLEAQTVHVRGTKTERADRVLAISDELAERLATRAGLHGTRGQVFGVTRYASKAGEPRNTNNVLKTLRTALAAAGMQWAGSHTFRRTVATWMDEQGAPLSEIANQLGHADTNVTARYLGRTVAPTRAAAIMVLGVEADSEPESV